MLSGIKTTTLIFFFTKNVFFGAKKRQFNYLLLIKYWNLRDKRFPKESIYLLERINLRESLGLFLFYKVNFVFYKYLDGLPKFIL